MILSWKLISIGVSTISGYAAIAHFRDYPLFGIMYYAAFFDAVLIYIGIYEKAFMVPLVVENTKSSIVSAAKRLWLRTQRRILRRQVRSIPSLAIQVGSFYTMDSTSTPVFLDYVVNNVVSMLVAYE